MNTLNIPLYYGRSHAAMLWRRSFTYWVIGCVEVLRPSQPNGVMSSAVSLSNHTFTGQA